MSHSTRKTVRRVGAGVAAVVALGAAAGTAMATHATSGSAGGAGATSAKASGKAASAHILTWNTCANTSPKGYALCPNGQNTGKVTAGIRWHMKQVDGLNAVFLQEICKADVDRLNHMDGLEGWHFAFSGSAGAGKGDSPGKMAPRQCAGGRGGFGIAVGVKADDAKFTEHRFSDRNIPKARDYWGTWNVQETAICADSGGTRYCSTHLTPFKGGYSDWSDEKAAKFLTAQRGEVEEVTALGKGQKRVVMGGDLNSGPKDTFQHSGKTVDMLAPLYDSYKECSQDANGGQRAGKGTFQYKDSKGNTKRGKKLDYIFTNKSAKASCPVSDAPVTLSDHVAVAATVTF